MMDEHMKRGLLHFALLQQLYGVDVGVIKIPTSLKMDEKLRYELECGDDITVNITDMDMLLYRIDAALDMGDSETFHALTAEMKRMEAVGRVGQEFVN